MRNPNQSRCSEAVFCGGRRDRNSPPSGVMLSVDGLNGAVDDGECDAREGQIGAGSATRGRSTGSCPRRR